MIRLTLQGQPMGAYVRPRHCDDPEAPDCGYAFCWPVAGVPVELLPTRVEAEAVALGRRRVALHAERLRALVTVAEAVAAEDAA